MTENQKKILEMVADKKITVEEAYRLLSLIQPSSDSSGSNTFKELKPAPKYLRVIVDAEHNWEEGRDKGPVHINVRVPVALIRAGVKLASLIPPEAYNQMDEKLKNRGLMFDLRNMKPENIEELIRSLNDLQVDIDGSAEKVRVYTE
jgi:galactose-1-phosphate uridylyltransferase